jgi:hypothetical protein
MLSSHFHIIESTHTSKSSVFRSKFAQATDPTKIALSFSLNSRCVRCDKAGSAVHITVHRMIGFSLMIYDFVDIT